MTIFFIKTKRPEGFVILFSIVVSAIVLLITAGMFRIASQETILSATSRESLRAFYAADSGIECALGNEVGTAVPLPDPITCNGSTHDLDVDGTFVVSFTDENVCARVTITESIDPDTNVVSRQVVSRGFNSLCDLSTGNPDYNYRSLVERSIRIRFVQNVATPPDNTGGGGNLLDGVPVIPTGLSLDDFPTIDISKFPLSTGSSSIGAPESSSGL